MRFAEVVRNAGDHLHVKRTRDTGAKSEETARHYAISFVSLQLVAEQWLADRHTWTIQLIVRD